MEWADDAIVLSLRRHGETAAILETLTRAHGRHLGLVYGGASSKARAMLQPGNLLRVQWRARLAEHLGSFTAELALARAATLFDHRPALAGLNAFTAVASAVLPEREAHGPAFEAAEALLGTMADHEIRDWAPLFIRWELGVLDELGFGLDLARCAATGATDDLIYVSPRSGRAVSREAGEPYRGQLLILPAFLLGRQAGAPDASDIAAGFALTGFFLEKRVLAPHGKTLPPVRAHLVQLAAKAEPESDTPGQTTE
jgi:DNA repair protein RecO (recombination protein O)